MELRTKETMNFTRAQFQTWKREMKVLAHRRAALAGGGKREVARRRDAIFHMRMNAANGVVGL